MTCLPADHPERAPEQASSVPGLGPGQHRRRRRLRGRPGSHAGRCAAGLRARLRRPGLTAAVAALARDEPVGVRRAGLPRSPVGARQPAELHRRRPAADEPDQPARDPRRRGRLGLDLHLVSQPSRRGVRPLRRVLDRPRGADGARPRHRLARGQLGLQRELDRHRARRVHERHPVPGRRVPRLGQARRLAGRHLPDHARPQARDRALPGAGPEPSRGVGRRRPPHGSRPHLELDPLHGVPALGRAGHRSADPRQRRPLRRALRPVRLARREHAVRPLRGELPGRGAAQAVEPGAVPGVGARDRPLRPAHALAVRGRLREGGRGRHDHPRPAHRDGRRGPRLRQVPVRRQLQPGGGRRLAAPR